jgi:hypothetical protein
MIARLRADLDILDPAVLADVVAGAIRISPSQAMRLYGELPLA